MKLTQSCPTLCNPMDYTVHGILQARILEWVAVVMYTNNPERVKTETIRKGWFEENEIIVM